MLNYASNLPDDYEYGIVWWGQSNATANGSSSDGQAEDPHLILGSPGINVVLSGPMAGTGTETVTVTTDASAAISGDFAGGRIRAGRPATPRAGYATVVSNTTISMTITWISPGPVLAAEATVTITNASTTATVAHTEHGMATGTVVLISGATTAANNGSFQITVTDADSYTYTMATAPGSNPDSVPGLLATGTLNSYTYFTDGRNSKYDNVRVLQAYLPNEVEANPTAATPLADPSSAYSALPTTVDTYSKLGLFLPFTFIEGISGFGIRAAATAPSATTLTVAAGFEPNVMDGALVRAESLDASAVLTTVSTGTVASHLDTVNFATTEVDITAVTDSWGEAAHGMRTGQLVVPALTSGALPTTSAQIVDGSTYFVIRVDANNFQLATTRALAIAGTNITISSAGTGGIDWHTAAFTTTSDEPMVITADDEIDLGTVTHGLVTGQMIRPVLLSGTFPTTTPQITLTSVLFAIVVDVYQFKLASTYADAIAGTAIVLTTANIQDMEWHTDTILTLSAAGWAGGTPSGTTWQCETWLPHWFDNPHALAAGPGFLYPTNESQPLAAVHNRPRGNTTIGWGARWGSMLSYASRLADATGKRVNVIPLAYDSTGIISSAPSHAGPSHGWLTNGLRIDWNPSNTSGLADRLKTLVTVTSPAALTAEGNSKPLRILCIAGMQGETEATTAAGRAQYKNLLPMFYSWLRNVIYDAGLSYYSSAEKMPIAHAGIRITPWEDTGATADTAGLVNDAITDFTAKTEFAATIDVNDSPLIAGDLHFDGEGEAINGRLFAEALIQEVDDALSSEEAIDNPVVLTICNMALAYIGDVAKITSLNTTDATVTPYDNSAQAVHCKRYFSEAREILLQQMAWSFATRRMPLAKVTDARSEEWAFAYGYPNNAVRVFAVLPPGAGDDYSASIHGTAVVQNSTGERSIQSFAHYVPLPFTVEQDNDGHRVIYTNTDEAVGRYNILITDARQYSPLFRNCLALKLASMLSGPIIKGPEGAKMTGALLQMLELELGKAKVDDAIQHNVRPEHIPPSIKARW